METAIPGFTRHTRGGWVRTYQGRTLWCGGSKATRRQVEETFDRKRKALDAEAEGMTRSGPPTLYREVLGAFLGHCEARVETGKPRPMSKRTLHNYTVALNQFGKFVGGGRVFADTNDPQIFDRFARKFSDWKASGYDSVISRVCALYQWAADMDYIAKFRPGPGFQRPAKSAVQDDRIDLSLTFTADEFSRLYEHANATMRCLLGLGLFCAMNNSEVAHLDRACVDLDAAVIDFTRRKVGKVRRICPLPPRVVADLRAYVRPEPASADLAGLFFLTENGRAYVEHEGKPTNSLSRLFRKLETAAQVAHKAGRNFKGLRTTWYNAAMTMPERAHFDLERRVIMGRAAGTVDFDSYLEGEGVAGERLRKVSEHVAGMFPV